MNEIRIPTQAGTTDDGAGAAAAAHAPPVALSPELAGWVTLLRSIQQRRRELAAVEEEARQKITEALGQAVEGRVDGRPVVRWTPVTTRRLDTRRLRNDHPELAAAYTEEREHRRFTLCDVEGVAGAEPA